MFPVLGREVVESKQRVSILAQAIGGLLVFQHVALDEGVERQFGSDLGFSHPYLLQRAFGFRLLAFRQLGEHVGGLVCDNPAASLPSSAASASEKSPVEIPFRYRIGSS